jgi:ABC-2 type transport system permease protein
MTVFMFTGLAVVRERERGNLEMLIATPVSPWELTVGKVLPFVGIGLVQVTVVVLLGKLVFDVPIRGLLPEVYAAALLFIIANLALGILISTLAGSQFQAMQLAFFVFLPQILLSGFMFPYAGMPVAAQWIAEVLPLTHFIRLIRAIMVRGAQLGDLPNDMLALAAIAAVLLIASTRRIVKRLD